MAKGTPHPHVGQPVRWLHSAAGGYRHGVVTEHRGDHAVVTLEDGSRVVRNVGEYQLLEHVASALTAISRMTLPSAEEE